MDEEKENQSMYRKFPFYVKSVILCSIHTNKYKEYRQYSQKLCNDDNNVIITYENADKNLKKFDLNSITKM